MTTTPADFTEEDGFEIQRGVDRIPHLGHYIDDRGVVVVLLPRDGSASDLPTAAAGYPIQYLWSDLTAAEMQSARDEVTKIVRKATVRAGSTTTRWSIGCGSAGISPTLP